MGLSRRLGDWQPSRRTGAPRSLEQSRTLSSHTPQEVGGSWNARGALGGKVDVSFASGRPGFQGCLSTLPAQRL